MKEKITSFQVSALIMFTIAPTGILLVPGAITAFAKQNAWQSAVLGTLIGIGIAALIGYICNQNPGMPLMTWLERRFGRWACVLIGLFLARYYITVSVITLSEFSNFISDEVLHRTPQWLTMTIIMLVVLYAVGQGIETIVRVNMITFLVSALLIAAGSLLIVENMHAKPLLPLWEGSFAPVLKGSLLPASWLSEVAVLLLLAPYIKEKNSAIRTGVAGVALAGAAISATVAVSIATFGPKLVPLITYPGFFIVSVVEIGSLLERLEIVFISIWLLTMYLKLSVLMFGAAQCLIQTFRIRSERPFLLALGLFVVLNAICSWGNAADFYSFTVKAGFLDLLFSNVLLPALIAAGLLVTAKGTRRQRSYDANDS
ncbi:spore germination protein KB [Cohnella sp. OV330]|uniref:GerAB/ArcD/ProY family transporter n=1 Tax=Cohnella sp. OV330 TaxID=1855288 RepID=UPI0008EE7BF2|nr:endospore germination permease [Cohnella sp. OV330]SFA92928.1 spore germination protein KB [Cohnella sp. OV330]